MSKIIYYLSHACARAHKHTHGVKEEKRNAFSPTENVFSDLPKKTIIPFVLETSPTFTRTTTKNMPLAFLTICDSELTGLLAFFCRHMLPGAI